MRTEDTSKKYKRWILMGILLLITFFVIGPYYLFLKRDLNVSPLKTLFLSGGLKKVNNQVNLLILGIPGGNHEGPFLSDSMIVLNYDFSKKRLVTIGIPRDVWSSTLQDRVNSAYAYGEAKKKSGGLTLAKAEIGSIVGTPIQYVIVMNFSEFKDLIDYLGGVDIDVKNSFVDKKFPIEGKENDECNGDPDFKCRYQTVRFSAGKQHMDGKKALVFVRSRNAEGKEGSDFARSLRQQQVTEELKNKIVKTTLSFNLKKTKDMYAVLDKSIQRDISNQEVASLGKRIVFNRNYYQKNFGLPRELFTTPIGDVYEGRYVLIPKKDSKIVHKYVRCLFDKESEKECEYLKDD